ncbi:MAG: hypothetical protein ABI675_06630 [Chitinophagaceae bacterium]
MNIKTLFSIITTFFSLLSFIYGQNIEKVTFDPKDSTAGYYLSIQPQSKNIKGVVVLLTSFLSPENLLPETKLHNVAYTNDILTIVTSTKQKLYADSAAVKRITVILKDVVTRFSADTSKFALAGYDEAGNIALRYTELAYQNPSSYLVQPKAIVGIDSPVDLFGLWHWAEKQIKKNYWPGAVGDAKYYLDAMTKENGTIYTNPEAYKKLSPFNRNEETPGNERYLRNVPVRLYYDTDIEWQLRNRRNSFYDTKMADGSELISRLLLSGNDQAEFIASKQPGLRTDGSRRPNSISIVNEVECIHWIKKSLNIFDPNTWVAPYRLIIPAGWTTEHFSLPPGFAPQLTYKGVEDIRFAPGWGDSKSDEHWSYCFLWWLEGSPKIDAAILQVNLKAYYEGLVSGNIADVPANKLIPISALVKKIMTATGDTETFNATISMLDYHTRQPMVLNCLIHVKECNTQKHTVLYFEASPKTLTHPVWKKMHLIGDSFECEK